MSDPAKLPTRAAILCGEHAFRVFVAGRLDLGPVPVTVEAAAEYMRTACAIKSRRELAKNADAAQRFEALRTDFDAWRGRIGQHR
ncbi:MAG: hypothetical protein AAFY75_04105 [Pseudomonadota bacterium]